MNKRKRGTDFVTPPVVPIKEGYKNYPPVFVNHTYHRILWITSEKVIQPGKVIFTWVLADRDGIVKTTATSERVNLPAKFKKYLEA